MSGQRLSGKGSSENGVSSNTDASGNVSLTGFTNLALEDDSDLEDNDAVG